jgi:carbamoyltransferase
MGRVCYPHSLGVFYQSLTRYLGFPHYGDEYKVMGLAPYGQPSRLKEMRQVVLLNSDGTLRSIRTGSAIATNSFNSMREHLVYRYVHASARAIVGAAPAAAGPTGIAPPRHRSCNPGNV